MPNLQLHTEQDTATKTLFIGYLAEDGDVHAERVTTHLAEVLAKAGRLRCLSHPAYEPDYCPLCGTARVIGTGR